MLCISLLGIFFSLKNSENTSDSTSTTSSVSFNIYFLSLNSTMVESQAVQLGKDYMAENYSGYIWKNEGHFHCIASAYKNENDAILVKNKLEKEGVSSQIVSVGFPSIKLSSNYSIEERQAINNSLNCFHDIYTQLFDISISLDNNLSNETSASLALNNVLSKLDKIKNDFETLFSDSQNSFISEIGRYLVDAHESLCLLKEKSFITPSQTLSSLIKYRYCEILDLNYNLILDLSTTSI